MTSLSLTMVLIDFIFPGLVHRGSWRRLRTESCVLRQRGLASGTWANRISHLRSYVTFTTYYNVPDFPVQLRVLLRYIAILGRGSMAYNSVANILSSIKWFASVIDPPSTKIFDAVLVTVSMKGLKAQLSRPVRQKLPLCIEHLVKFYNSLDLSNMLHLSGWIAMLIAFFGCLRLSNLVPARCSKFDPLKQLTRADIRFKLDFVLLCYKWSKTNQNTSKVLWVPIIPASDQRFNVKFHLERLFVNVKLHKDDPLFSYDRNQFHSRYSLSKLLEICLAEAALSPKDYSWHSFRRGSAMFAFEQGLADSAVQLLGDWSSSAFKRYLEFDVNRRADVAEIIAEKFDHCVRNC